MTKFFVKFFSFCIAVLVSVAFAGWLIVYAIPPQFEDLAPSVLVRRYDRLMRIDSPKIILVGGSSGAFGLDRLLLEQETGMPVCNMALAAGLGMPFTTNLIKESLQEGDLVVLAYEYVHWNSFDENLQPEIVMAACDSRPGLLRYVEPSSRIKLLRYFPTYAFKKINSCCFVPIEGGGVNQSGAYNEDGDLIYPRPECVLPEPVTVQAAIHSNISPEFAAFVNDFYAYALDRGAQVVISSPPLFDEALISTPEEIQTFENALQAAVDCPVISAVDDYIFPRSLMYDTVYHCNEAGARERTLLLAKDIERYLTTSCSSTAY